MTQISILKGNIGKDPEIKYTQSQMKVATFSIACYRANPKDKDKPFTDWFNCVAFGDQADIAETQVKKGMLMQLTGKFQTRSYDNSEGKKVYVTEFWVDDTAKVLKKEKVTEVTTDQIYENGSIYPSDELPF